MISPGASLEMSMVTGDPSARAVSLGSKDSMNGTAASATPTAPTAAVVVVSIRRRSRSGSSSIGLPDIAGAFSVMLTSSPRKLRGNPRMVAAPLPRVTCCSVSPAGKPFRECLQEAVRPAAIHHAVVNRQSGVAARAHHDLIILAALLEHDGALLELAQAENRRLRLRDDDGRGEQAAAHPVIGQ